MGREQGGGGRRATAIGLLSLSISHGQHLPQSASLTVGTSHGRLPSSMACVDCGAAETVVRTRLSAFSPWNLLRACRWNLRVCNRFFGFAMESMALHGIFRDWEVDAVFIVFGELFDSVQSNIMHLFHSFEPPDIERETDVYKSAVVAR